MRPLGTLDRDAVLRRIQRDLHDGVQQEIVALIAKLALVRSSIGRDPGLAGTLVEELQREALRIIDDLRELAHGIYPSVLSDLGLLAAVEANARRIPIPVAVTASVGLRAARFAPAVEESAFYFVAESLTNVLKHARATRVMISLVIMDRELKIEIRDNGTGLPSTVRAGSGLSALRDRIQAVGGLIMVRNAASGGACVCARIPLDPVAADEIDHCADSVARAPTSAGVR